MKTSIITSLLLATSSLFAQNISVHITSGNNSNDRLTTKTPIQLNTQNVSSSYNITIKENEAKQTIEGFGYTLTNGSAELFMTLSQSKRTELLTELYGTSGINASMIRIPIGSCDLSSSLYSYNDNVGDTDMSEFSFGPDANHLIPVLKEIKAINPNIKLLATPWSAPKWMKTEDKWNGGSLKEDMKATYALYLKTYLEKMNTAGLTVWGLSIQNEPLNSYNYPAMYMTANQQVDFIENYLKSQVQSLTFTAPKIIGFDHNLDNDGVAYAKTVGNNSNFTDGLAFHYYNNSHGNKGKMTEIYNETGKGIYFSEQYTPGGESFNSQLGWHMEHVVIGSLQNWSKTVFNWNVASDPQYKPTTDPSVCRDCGGAVTIENGNYTIKTPYYIIGQVSKFVVPGAVVLNTTSNNNDIARFNIAFKNPDGSIVFVFFNEMGSSSRDITVNIGGKSFAYSIPSRSAVTFKWTEVVNSVPETPTNLTSSLKSNKVVLNWTASSGAASYEVLRSSSLNGTYTTLASNVLTNTYEDATAVANQTYFYKVQAVNIKGKSSASNSTEITYIPYAQLIPNGNYRFVSSLHNQGMSAINSGAYMTSINENDNKQIWTVTHIDEDVYTIKNVSNGFFMGLPGNNWCGSFGAVSPVSTESDDDIRYKIVEVGTDSYAFQIAFNSCAVGSSNSPIKAWTVENSSLNARISLSDFNSSQASQKFELIGIPVGLIDSYEANDRLTVFPVPSNTLITVTDNEFKTIEGSISILNIDGKLMKQMEITSPLERVEIDISDLENGIYFLQVIKNNTLMTKKIIVSK